MSKSLGNVIDPIKLAQEFGADALRFYCFREVTFGRDGAVSTAGFAKRYETELANDYGNLASRVVAMVVRYRDSITPAVATDSQLAGELGPLAQEVSILLDRAEISQALDAIWTRVRRLNRYVEEQAPWVLAKDEARGGELDCVLASLVEGVRMVTVALHAYLPASTQTLLGALGETSFDFSGAVFREQGSGVALTPLAPLFPKL